MKGFDILRLISTHYETDELGQSIPLDEAREVLARVESVTLNEFAEAGRIGLRPVYRATLNFAEDYQQEEVAEFDGHRYAIYRTYLTPGGGVELYLTKETGVSACGSAP